MLQLDVELGQLFEVLLLRLQASLLPLVVVLKNIHFLLFSLFFPLISRLLRDRTPRVILRYLELIYGDIGGRCRVYLRLLVLVGSTGHI